MRNDFERDFQKSKKRFNLIFRFVFGMIIVIMIAQFAFYGFVGKKAYESIQENDGSVGKTIGSFIGEVQKGINEAQRD